MATRRLETVNDFKARADALRAKFKHQHDVMRAIARWTEPDPIDLEREIWREVPENAKRITDPKPHIGATSKTVVSFLTGRRPKASTLPRNPDDLQQKEWSPQFERIGMAVYDTFDAPRSVPLNHESAKLAVDRGVLCGRILYLTPEERGENRYEETIEAPDLPAIDTIPGIEADEGGYDEPFVLSYVDGEQVFPLDLALLDPLDCTYTRGKDGAVIEFIHEYKLSYIELCDQWPDLADMDIGKSYSEPSQWDQPLRVIDYWDREINAIIVEDQFYKKPTEHGYTRLPFKVELIDAVKVRKSDGTVMEEGRPFCYPMLHAIRRLSHAESLLATHLAESGLPKLTLENYDVDNSTYVHREGDQIIFDFAIDFSKGDIVPLAGNKYGGERLQYLQPAPQVPLIERSIASYKRDLELVSFAEALISGAATVDLSGYAYNQMKQASIARIEPCRIGLDRFWGGMLTLAAEMSVENWDYMQDTPLMLSTFSQDRRQPEQMPVTLDMLQAVGGIHVRIYPEVPVNREQEVAPILQQSTTGHMSKLVAIDKLGEVDDPQLELERMAFERMAEADPRYMAALAQSYAKKVGLEIPEPVQPAMPPDGSDPGVAGPPTGSAIRSLPPSGQPGNGGPEAPGSEPMNPAAIMQMLQGT